METVYGNYLTRSWLARGHPRLDSTAFLAFPFHHSDHQSKAMQIYSSLGLRCGVGLQSVIASFGGQLEFKIAKFYDLTLQYA